MGIFHIFKKKENTYNEGNEQFNNAQKAFEGGNYQEALRLLVFAFSSDPSFLGCYKLANECLLKLGATDEANLFKDAITKFNSFEPFYNLGYHFIDVGHNRMAIPFLERALSISPGDLKATMELTLALTAQFQPGKAKLLLEKVDKGEDFWVWYQYYWYCLLSNSIEGIEEFISSAKGCFGKQSAENENIANCVCMIEKLEECFLRHKTILKPEMFIKYWHYIQYGSVVIQYFDDNEENLNVAGGRYVAKWGSNEEIKSILLRLKGFLEKLNLSCNSISYLPDRDSEIIGKVLSELMRLPSSIYKKQLEENQLIIAANNNLLNEYPELAEISNGQIVFAFNQDWLNVSTLTPDICGLMSQTYFFPWNGGLKVNSETGKLDQLPPDQRSTSYIVTEILSENIDVQGDFGENVQFYMERKEYLKCSGKAGKKRLPFRVDSPVPGSYFC
ncbi:MAG TPA: tetratricopeptide repeat protein [Pseudobacteroides sp.]|uniref:tetratricopeptide repeat protein n=1 Tax=Pseudobacteroides sp. TaxID=1968840 RepID=UPI002F95180E